MIAPSAIPTTLAVLTVASRQIENGISGSATRVSITRNAASSTAAAISSPIVRPVAQPTSGAFEIEQIRSAAAEEKEAAVRDRIRGDDPLQALLREMQVGPDCRQRDVDDRDVE